MTAELVTLLGEREVGRVRNSRGRSTFIYDDDWRDGADSYPLSLSMPLAAWPGPRKAGTTLRRRKHTPLQRIRHA